ncbi:MAG: peroxiredoxin, partial [Minisyncoccia bacterium]
MIRINLTLNQKAPDFKLKDQNGKNHRLSDYRGKWVLIYFYPKDDTPGCTKQGINFTNLKEEFEKLNVQ